MQAHSHINPESILVSNATDKVTTSAPRLSERALAWPATFDWGLLVLRIWFGLSLFLKHGWEKPTNFAQMAQHFPNPLHVGPVPGLLFALISDAICSILVVLGLATRWAALWSFVNILIAWSFIHHFQFFGKGADHGEAIVLYLGGFLALVIMGPGRFSLDRKLGIGNFTRPRSSGDNR
jgi:putative oxidoreductase